MALVSTKIVVPQHIDYLIVDRELIIFEYSQYISRFFSSNQSLSRGKDIQEFIPELTNYKQIIKNILEDKQKYFYLPQINCNFTKDLYFTISITKYESVDDDRNYLIIFLEDITHYGAWTQSLLKTIDQYSLFHESSIVWNELAKYNYFYERVLASMAEALIITSDSGIIQLVNQTTVNLLGYSQAELIAKSINEIIADRSFPLSEIQQYLLTQGELLKNIEVNCQTKQGLTKTISFTCSLIKTEENESCTFIYLGRDTTKIKRYLQRQTVQYLVSKILASSQGFSQAAVKILQVICENFDLILGEIWVAKTNEIAEPIYQDSLILSYPIEENEQPENYHNNLPSGLKKVSNTLEEQYINFDRLEKKQGYCSSQDHLNLRCLEIWTKKPNKLSKFIDTTQNKDLKIGEGIAGNIWLKESFCWFNDFDFTQEVDFTRKEIALQSGLKGVFGFPILSDDSVLAVMNFFLDVDKEIDENLADLMVTIANQISQFIQREKAEAALKIQQQQSEKLLLNILPEIIAKQLTQQNSTIAEHFEIVTILFADLVNFTNLFEKLSPTEVVEILNEIFSEFDYLTTKYGLEKIKTIGDAYMVVGGLPQQRQDHAEAIAEMALDMQLAIAQFNRETDKTLSIRIGINTGAVIAGVIGTKKFSYDLWGDAVNIARRMESHGIPDNIQVTASTYQLLKSKYYFQPRGNIKVKGKGTMSTYLLLGRKSLPE